MDALTVVLIVFAGGVAVMAYLRSVEEAWEREADRREAEIKSGLIAAVLGQEAIDRLQARLLQ